MKLLKNKKFYASILIDFSFLTVLYLLLLFIFNKIQGYALKLQEFGLDLKQFEAVAQKNISLLNYNLLLGNIELMNQVIQKILIFFFLLLVGSFLMYILFQGVQWSFILSNLKNFKKYFWKFSLVSLFSFSLSILFLYYALLNVRSIFINYFTGVSIFGLVVKILLLLILLFVLGYYTHVCYVLLAKNKIIDALKKTFKFRNLKSILTSFGLFLLIIGIIVFFLMFNLVGLFWFVVMLFLILFVWNYCRYNLVRILK